jgi:GT2 family glycosyltransferase
MLQRFLPSVVDFSEADGAVVYVADNGSTDASVAMVRQHFPTVRLILLEKNYGFAEGYNRALEQLDARYVVLLNSDVEVTAHWLRPLVAFMDIHPEAAACQPKLRSWYRRDEFEYAGAAGGFIDKYGYPFCRGRIMNKVEKDHGQYDNTTSVFWATGAAMFVRLQDFRAAGGFDNRFFAHMEEIDLCWRFRARGKLIACVPQSVVYHVGAATLKRENPEKTFLNFRNNLLMLYKNLPAYKLRHVMQVRCMLDYLAALFFLMRGDRKNARAVILARRAYKRLRPDFWLQRKENLNKQTHPVISEQTKRSILLAALFHAKP